MVIGLRGGEEKAWRSSEEGTEEERRIRKRSI
jgi:hypothetical protein